jgi:hypothetical protein
MQLQSKRMFQKISARSNSKCMCVLTACANSNQSDSDHRNVMMNGSCTPSSLKESISPCIYHAGLEAPPVQLECMPVVWLISLSVVGVMHE